MIELPIDAHLAAIRKALIRRGALALSAEPGAGKTTRVPPAVLDALGPSGGEVWVCQPRRVAARLAATHVARERGERLGERVGYEVRLDRKVSARTRLRYVTDGLLLRALAAGSLDLKRLGCVVLDEVHERRLASDALLAWLNAARREDAPHLKLLVMSATLAGPEVAAFLDAPLIEVPGRTYPVAIEHQKKIRTEERLEHRVARGLDELATTTPLKGSVLVFLPGTGEIARAERACGGLADRLGLAITPLHGSLPPAAQDRALAARGGPRLILSTNVAETSVTPPDVTAVIDTGLHREAGFDPWTGVATLTLRPISRASAKQRAGRAGRVREGRCLRLYSRQELMSRPEHAPPEIERADLAELFLLLGGADRPAARLRWLTPPPAAAAEAATELLKLLGATDAEGRITELGLGMLRYPLAPRLARVVVESARLGCGRLGAQAAALLAEWRPSREDHAPAIHDEPSDVLVRLDQLERGRTRSAPRAREVAKRIAGRLPRGRPPELKDRGARETALLQAFLAGFPDRVAKRREPGGNRLLIMTGSGARLAESSAVQTADWMVLLEARRAGDRSPDPLVTAASRIDPDWLLDRFPDQIREETRVTWLETRQRVEAAHRMVYGALPLIETALDKRTESPEAEALLLAKALARGAESFAPKGELDELQRRSAFAHTIDPTIPALSESEIEAALGELCRGCRSFADLNAKSLIDHLRYQILGEKLKSLDALAPSRLRISTTAGPKGGLRVHYETSRAPWIEGYIQDFFGQTEGPTVGGGDVPLVIHLKAPNKRDVQVTQDLAGFWVRHYPALRRELSRRYPRHHWPEDPASAEPRLLKRKGGR
ncbi:MAG: ATP-dependent helicase HrpB [Planctomycetota bacterium]